MGIYFQAQRGKKSSRKGSDTKGLSVQGIAETDELFG